VPDSKHFSIKDLLLAVLHGVSMDCVPESMLLQIGEYMGISKTSVQKSLNELIESHYIHVDENRCCSILPERSLFSQHFEQWRLSEQRRVIWDGSWLVCDLPVICEDSDVRKRSLWALDLLGFKETPKGILRPNNLLGGIDALRLKLKIFGIEANTDLFSVNDYPKRIQETLKTDIWPITALTDSYHDMYQKVDTGNAMLKSRVTKSVLVYALKIGYEAVTMLAIDPLLPVEMQDPKPRIKLTRLLLELIVCCTVFYIYESDSKVTQVKIPSGTFLFGCMLGDKNCQADEGPEGGSLIHVPAFKIDLYETSVAEYKQCVEASVCSKPFTYKRTHYCNYDAPGRENYPLNCVNWEQASNYCEWKGGRLPYEVEWEKAARNTELAIYPWGNELASCKNSVMDPGEKGESDFETDGCWRDLSWPRNSFQANKYGLYDMAGGTSEWLQDWYHVDSHNEYYFKGKLTGPNTGSKKVIKGGSWDEKYFAQRVSNRFAKPTTGNPDLYGSNGIRCVTPLSDSLSTN